MSSNHICTPCLRALRHQLRHRVCSFRAPAARSFFTTQPPRAEHASLPPSKPSPPPSAVSALATSIRNSPTLRAATEPYVAYAGTETLLQHCLAQSHYAPPRAQQPPDGPGHDISVDSTWWYRAKPSSTTSVAAGGGLGLTPTFNTWAQVVFLHMYLVTARLRCFPAAHVGVWHQQLLDHFFYAAEDAMAARHAIDSRGVRNRYLKELWGQWRGVVLSYDEGLIRGDAALGAAVWRNVFRADDAVDVADVAVVVGYMRRQLRMLEGLGDEAVAEGRVRFGSPAEGRRVGESVWMHRGFAGGDGKGLGVKGG